jgi:hypothetical protein
LENIKDQIELPNMFKKYTYDDMKGLLETWMETGQVGETEEPETQPTQTNNQTKNEPAAATTSNSDVKDAFEDLFNN